MPLKIIKTPNDPVHSCRAVYIADSSQNKGARPQGDLYRDENGALRSRRADRRNQQANSNLFVGLDLGQANDFTALVIVERNENGHAVRHIERTRFVSYPDIAARVSNLMARPELNGAQLLVDRTGVGRPVYDLLRTGGLNPIGITITGGSRVTGNRRNPRVPKRDLINAVLLALQSETLFIAADLPGADLLRQELADMRAKVTAAGHDQYEARAGTHDDLTIALAIAIWV